MLEYTDFVKRALKFRNLYFTRKEYWSFFGLSLLSFFIIYILGSFMLGFLVDVFNLRDSYTTIANIALCIPIAFLIFFVLVNFLGEIGRLHNSGRSGLNLLWSLIPYVGSIIVIVLLCSSEAPAKDNKYAPKNLNIQKNRFPNLQKSQIA